MVMKYNTITLKFPESIANNFRAKFPQLKKARGLSNCRLVNVLIKDELRDFTRTFDVKYYNDNDILELFKV